MNDQKLEQIVGVLLRTGVSISAAMVLAGGAWYLAQHGGSTADYHHFSVVRDGGKRSNAEWLIWAGLVILMATPVARVAFALVAFAMERDRIYVWITLVVLGILLYSIGSAWL